MNPKNNENPQKKPKKELTEEEKEEARKKGEESKRKAKEKKEKKKAEAAALAEGKPLPDSIITNNPPSAQKKKKEANKKDEHKKEDNKNKEAKSESKSAETKIKKEDIENKKPKSESKSAETKIKVKRMFAFTSLEERENELLEKQKELEENSKALGEAPNQKKNITSKDIIEMLRQGDPEYRFVNEELIFALTFIMKRGLNKQAKSCSELLEGIKKFVSLVDGDNNVVINEIKSLIDHSIKIIEKHATLSGGLYNTIKFLQEIKQTFLPFQSDTSTPTSKIKEEINNKIEEFITTKINTKDYMSTKSASNLIKENDVILIYGKSKVFRNILQKAVNDGFHFKVIFVDNRKANQLRTEVEYLSKLGMDVMYTFLSGVSSVITKVTKVWIKGKAMFSNGDLQGQTGTALVSCIAKSYKKPVIAFCQSFKFWNKTILNSRQNYEVQEYAIEDKINGFSYKKLDVDFDITPAHCISMLVTDMGYIPPTSVPVIIREFEQKLE